MKEMHTCETYGTQGIDKVGRNRLHWYQLYNEWRKLVTRAAVEQVESEARARQLSRVCWLGYNENWWQTT